MRSLAPPKGLDLTEAIPVAYHQTATSVGALRARAIEVVVLVLASARIGDVHTRSSPPLSGGDSMSTAVNAGRRSRIASWSPGHTRPTAASDALTPAMYSAARSCSRWVHHARRRLVLGAAEVRDP